MLQVKLLGANNLKSVAICTIATANFESWHYLLLMLMSLDTFRNDYDHCDGGGYDDDDDDDFYFH